MTVYPWHGKDWDAYTKLRENGALDGVKEIDWNEGMNYLVRNRRSNLSP